MSEFKPSINYPALSQTKMARPMIACAVPDPLLPSEVIFQVQQSDMHVNKHAEQEGSRN